MKVQKEKNLIAYKAEENRSLWPERKEQEGGSTRRNQIDGSCKACHNKDIELYHRGPKFSGNYSTQGSELLMPRERKHYLRRYAEDHIDMTSRSTESTTEE